MNIYECRERLSVRDAATLKDELLEYMQGSDGLIIDMTRLERTDLSILQVCIAASKEGKKRGLPVKFRGISLSVARQMMLCGMKK